MAARKKKRLSFTENLKQHITDVLRTKTSPHSIGLGFAIGTFIGVLVTFGVDVVLGSIVVVLYKKVNKFALFGALVFWNPAVMVPVYATSYAVGNFLLGATPTEKSVGALYQLYGVVLKFAVGNIILAVVIAIASYFLVRGIASAYQNRKK